MPNARMDDRRIDRSKIVFRQSTIVVAEIISLLSAFAVLRPGTPSSTLLNSWYSFANHIGVPENVAVLPTFFATALLVAAVFSALAAIVVLWSSKALATHGNAYLGMLEATAIVASALAVLLAAMIDTVPASGTLRIAMPVIAIAVAISLLIRRSGRPASGLQTEMHAFFTIWSQPLPSDDGVPPQQTLADFLKDPADPVARALAAILPVTIAATIVVLGALIVQFGWGTFAAVDPIVRSFHEADWSFSNSLTDIVKQFPVRLTLLFTALIFLLLILARKVGIRWYDGSRPLLVRMAIRAMTLALVVGLLALAAYSVLGPTSIRVSLAQKGGLLVSFLAGAASFSTLLIHRAPSIATRSIEFIHNLRIRRFWTDTNWIINQYPPSDGSKGYVFLHTQSDTYSIASLLLILMRLKQMGWTVIIMDKWPIAITKSGQKHLDRFQPVKLGQQRALNYYWHIDWMQQRVEAAGINFYHPIWEGLSRHFGRYSLDLESDSEAERVFRDILQIADATLLECFRILNTVAGHGKPVRIIGSSAQFVPNAIINMFCREYGKERDMHFCWVQQGYQTYYADKAKISKRISLQNMTRKWPYSNPYLPHTADFEAWIAKGQDTNAIIAEAEQWAGTNRATSAAEMQAGARIAFDRITAHKATGGAVVCVLGKMVFDLSTPFESGPAHDGMLDWLNHTIRVARDAPDVLFVVKPHPYESRPEIAGRVEQFFTDMIEVDGPFERRDSGTRLVQPLHAVPPDRSRRHVEWHIRP